MVGKYVGDEVTKRASQGVDAEFLFCRLGRLVRCVESIVRPESFDG